MAWVHQPAHAAQPAATAWLIVQRALLHVLRQQTPLLLQTTMFLQLLAAPLLQQLPSACGTCLAAAHLRPQLLPLP
jgi:hypothetical protein